MNYLNEIREFVVDNFLFGDDSELTEDTSFLETGIVDSTGILEIVSFLEGNYNITVEDEELLPENLDNLQNINQYLIKKLDQRKN